MFKKQTKSSKKPKSSKSLVGGVKQISRKKLAILCLVLILVLSIAGYGFNSKYKSRNASATGYNWSSVHFNNTTIKVCTYTSSANREHVRVKVSNPTSAVRWAQLIVNKAGSGQHQYDRINPADFNKIKDYYDHSGGVPRTFYFKVNIGTDEVTKSLNYRDINGCGSINSSNGDVVSVATQQYQRHGGINLEVNGFYLTYTGGNQEPWCAHFITWVFDEANREFPPGAYTNSVAGLRSWFTQVGRYHPKGPGYRPSPGDVAIYQNGMSHANIVISVSSNSYVAIGGNESDGINRRTYSLNDPNLSGFGRR